MGRVLAVVAFALLGCRSVADELPSLEVAMTDSSGVSIVRVPPLGEYRLPRVDATLEWTTASRGGVELFRPMDALFLDDGSLVVAHDGAKELLHIDGEGELLGRLGRDGEGPGEFRSVTLLMPDGDGGFLAFDPWLSRLSAYDAGGTFMETRRVETSPVVTMHPLAFVSDGSVWAAMGEQRFFLSSGERRDTVPLMVLHPDGHADTLGTWMGLERAFVTVPVGSAIVPIGFARRAHHAAGGGRIAIGSSDSLDVTVYSVADQRRVLRVIASDARVPATAEDVREWLSQIAEKVPGAGEELTRAWAEAPHRATLPAIGGLVLDDTGRLWVGEYLSPGVRERRWTVFGLDGMPLFTLDLPANEPARLPAEGEILALAGERIALLRKDRLDVESIEVWSYSAPAVSGQP